MTPKARNFSLVSLPHDITDTIYNRQDEMLDDVI